MPDQVNQLPVEEDPIEEPEEAGASFMQLYTSLMMLLMTFFIVLFSMATTSSGKFHEARDSVQDELAHLGLSATKRAVIFLYSYLSVTQSSSSSESNEKKDVQNQRSDSGDISEKDKKDPKKDDATLASEKGEKKNYTKQMEGEAYWLYGLKSDLSKKIDHLILLGVDVERKEEDMIFRIPNHSIFYRRSASITPKGKLILSKILSNMGDDFRSILIQAHTNETEENDTNKTKAEIDLSLSKLQLSSKQALSVASFISNRTGIDLDEIYFRGNANFHPLHFNPKTKAEIQSNDRLELWVNGLWLNQVEKSELNPGDLAEQE